MCGDLVFARRLDQTTGALFDVANQVMELARVLNREQARHFSAGRFQLAGFKQCQRQIVTVGVIGGVDRLGALKMWDRRIELASAQIKRGERAVRLERIRLRAHRFEQTTLDDGKVRSRSFLDGLRRRWRHLRCRSQRCRCLCGKQERYACRSDTRQSHKAVMSAFRRTNIKSAPTSGPAKA